jgi:hypothetical protein
MNQVKIKWVIIFIFTGMFSALKAQTPFNIKEKTGIITTVVLSDIAKLVFPAGKMTIIKKTGNNIDFTLNNIQYLNFNKLTSVDQVNTAGITSMLLYPNPVADRLNIRYLSSGEESIQIDVINLQGKIIIQQAFRSVEGINYINIPFNTYQKGIYLCRLKVGNKTEIAKFVK